MFLKKGITLREGEWEWTARPNEAGGDIGQQAFFYRAAPKFLFRRWSIAVESFWLFGRKFHWRVRFRRGYYRHC